MALRLIITITLLLLTPSSVLALDKKIFCIYDPVGKNGPSMTFLSDLVPKAITWGLNVELSAYTDEKIASNDFKAGLCDVALLTGLLTSKYVPFGGTLNAAGGIVSENGINTVLKVLADPKASELLSNGNYEIVGSYPVGGVYVFVKDRAVDSVEKFSGKKMSILNEDPQSIKLAQMVGASPIATSLATLSGQFNNGNIDLLLMVPIGYNVFELYQGLGENGGIIDEKLFYGMMQLIAHKDRFSNDFGLKMREYILSRLTDIHKLARDSKAEIPSRYWIKTSEEVKTEFDRFKRDIRLALRDEGVHHPKALRLLWKIRCSEDPTRSECSKPE